MTQARHTPLPFTVEDSKHIYDADGCAVAIYLESYLNGENVGQENAAFIVRACNSFYKNEDIKAELLEALKQLLDDVREWPYYRDNLKSIIDSEKAIAKAEGGAA